MIVEEFVVLLLSVVPDGGVIVAVFVSDKVEGETGKRPVMVTTSPPPAGRVGIVPDTAVFEVGILPGQTAPPDTEPQPDVTFVNPAGSVSLKVAPLALDGPLFLIVSV